MIVMEPFSTITSAAVVAVVGVAAVFFLQPWNQQLPPQPSSTAPQQSQGQQRGHSSDTSPLIWYAPFFSGGGYSSEAISFSLGLAASRPTRFGIVQHAEPASEAFARGLPGDVRATLVSAQQAARKTLAQHEPVLVICHSTPDVWAPGAAWGWDAVPCPPRLATYRIGRTMYETDRVPSAWVPRLNRMDELWVPTAFHVDTFRRSGVREELLHVVPEAVDSKFFDPDACVCLLC